MQRFFYDPACETAGQVLISGAEAHHLKTVLRMRPGDAAELLDGAGELLSCEIERIGADAVTFRILSRRREPEPSCPLTLAVALLKGKKLDIVIQKATELGVQSFVPVITRYCTPQGRESLERWQRIMLEACKQCGRAAIMQIHPPQPLHELHCPPDWIKIMPWEGETACSFSAFALRAEGRRPVIMLTGPEGGFHPDEVEQARSCGFTTVSFGPRILRAETAAITAAVLAKYALGGFDL